MSWETDLDRWLTEPPEYPDIVAKHCEHCGQELFAGDEAVQYTVNGTYYCDEACLIAELRDNRDVVTDVLEPPDESW